MKFWEPIKQYLDQHQELTVPIEVIVEQVQASEPSGWGEGATMARELATEQETLSQDLSGTLTKLESSWTGQGADLVAERLRKVRASAVDAQQAFAANENTHATGIAMHENLRNQLTSIPPAPTASPTPAIGLMNADVMSKLIEHDSAQQKNLDTYEKFTSDSQGNTQQLKVDYGTIGAYDGGDVTIQQHPSTEPKPQPGPAAPGDQPHAPGGVGTTFSPGTAHTSTSPHSSSAGNTLPGSGNDHTSTSGYTPPASGSDVDTPWRGGTRTPPVPGAGNEFGVTPISGPGDGRLGGISERLGGGSGRPGSGSGRSGAEGGPGRQGAGKPGGSSGRLGGEAGPRSGAGASEGAASRVAGERGAPGRKGLSGAAAPGAQRGKKEEDEEHERKYVLDVDLFADEGTAVDPETGMRPTPPTLGA
ncbi:hypothetical protein [Amycolatopsis dendrobii]|uniref:PPE family protein n=1 Tax=Amycolatopsis dendrobii TaxID=2760662 RepID=A0A7W3W157_9PSEU|nr:hypothetical protein [Amycolatopsis dendrobii]MBB1156920.1 hypothetical protein [Amycolatopsis dendrobii]